MKKTDRSPKVKVPKTIWARIRYYQTLDMPDTVLAEYLNVCTKTLHNYDKGAANLTLGQIGAYLEYTGRDITDLVPEEDF